MPMAARGSRELDLVVLGATGFVGRIVAQYLATSAQDRTADRDLPRVGLAGRSLDRLEEVRASLPGDPSWSLLHADTSDQDSLDALAERSRMVLSTVGPYARLGLGVVAACARHGTHYADLTGEPQFIRASIDAYDAMARASGARIVHSVGFDSVPSDLGVWDLARRVHDDGEGDLTDTTLVLLGGSGGFGGGSIHSLLGVLADVRDDVEQRRVVTDPYSLSPDRASEPDLGDQPLVRFARFDPTAGQWVIPFLPLGPSNERVVRRTNAMLGYPYGRSFRYVETIGLGTGPVRGAAALVAGLGMKGAEAALTSRLTGAVLDRVIRRVTPPPGAGPSEQARLNGSFRLAITTLTSTGARYVEDVAASGDPGYTATAMMMGEAALAQVVDGDLLPERSGVLTPAVAYGDVLLDRLRAAGMTIRARRLAPAPRPQDV